MEKKKQIDMFYSIFVV